MWLLSDYEELNMPVPRSYVATLEARIKTLEDAIQATGATLPPADPALGVFESEDAGLGLGPSNESSLSENNHPGDKSQTTPDERLPEDSGASVEAILDIGRLRLSVSRTTEDSEDLVGSSAPESSYFSYYGPTSSRFLSGQATAEPPVSGLFGRCGVRDSIDERKTSNLFDDPIETELLNKFWKWQDIHFMVVNRDIFLEAYKKGERESEWVSPMLIDMMLAIGVQFGHQGYGRKAIYAARAEALVIHELARPTMATLQAVQLLSIFQMGVGRVSVGWSLTGLVVAMSNKMGLHIDSTELVARGVMSQRMKDMRDSSFWGIFVLDRLFSIIMGYSSQYPSIQRQIGWGRTNQDNQSSHASPIDGSWIRFNNLIDIVETMLMDIYAFDAPVRTAMEDYNMLTKNNQIIQAYIDDLPINVTAEKIFSGKVTSLRPVALQQVKNSHHVHIFINLFILLINRPFIGSRQDSMPSSSARSMNAANQAIERRCRALAFGQCRTAALRIIALVKYFIHSPCFTTAYDIFSACTILLLCPKDPDAMKAVQTGLTYLDQLKQSHYWVESAEDSKRRILDLAQKWNAPILSEGQSPTSSLSQPSSHLSTPPQNDDDTAALLTGGIDPAIWEDLTQPIDWSAFPIPSIQSNPFTGPDAALFATYPSTELGSMYEQISVPMDLTTDFTQELNSLWYIGTQPTVELQNPAQPNGGCCGQCSGF
ncbi:Fungal specific transcription factor domain [Rhizoctonia solani]|uniref:Fungal specific transcription factor domain n=2 Tax=Rhizoctonia solani TaxID=456999 RepID=A0A8H8SS79_9AGAM|nr:Fungal specific transcription factor domain [Rhizoctonia solani]QRW16526.1 Fungal specific transcription factor domain [Rhizoctonia solani]